MNGSLSASLMKTSAFQDGCPGDGASRSEGDSGSGGFPLTRWTLVAAAGGSQSQDAGAALQDLCQLYWPPVYAFVRSWGRSRQEAEDLTQAFFASLLERDAIALADPERGRFRTFLLACLKNFLRNERRSEGAQKRGGGHQPVSLDAEQGDSWLSSGETTTDSPDRIFERQWASALLRQVFARLEAHYRKEDKAGLFEALSPLLGGVEERGIYRDLATQLGMTVDATRMAVFRMRNRFRDLLREEISETVNSEAEVNDEIDALFRAFH